MATSTQKTTKIDRFYDALASGQTFTVKQAMKRFKFKSPASAAAAVSDLREEGFNIRSVPLKRTGPGRPPVRYEMAG